MMAISRRRLLASTSALLALGALPARAQAPAAPRDTDWRYYANDMAATRYAPLDQINAGNFDKLEVAWRFSTNALGPTLDAYYNATPLIVKGRLFTTAGTGRYAISLDGATGQLLWAYHHDEKGRAGTRAGSGFGLSYWTDGQVERVLYVTRSYQLVALDAKTGLPDPAFGMNGEVDLRLDFDQEVDPKKSVLGLHAPPLVVKNTVVVGTAPTAAVKAYVRGFDVRTGKRKWIFHTIPMKGEFGYDTWQAGQAEASGNTSVWSPLSADEQLGLVYLPVETPPTDLVGVTRQGNTLFSETLVAVDVETGQRRWHYQMVHHGIWDTDLPSAAILCDIPVGGKIVKALAQPSKQGFLYVLDRETGKPVWPIPEKKVAKGDAPGEWYSPTQPIPSKPPPFERQGVLESDLIDWTPEIKARAREIARHYRMGPLYTPPAFAKPGTDGPWGTLYTPATQGGANWPGGSYDPETSIVYIYSKTALEALSVSVNEDGKLGQKIYGVPPIADANGGTFGGTASLIRGGSSGRGTPQAGVKDALTDPIEPGILSVAGLSILKPPYGRITAIDLKTGEMAWQVPHGETPDFVKNHPLLKGVTIPRTGQGGILGTLTTKSLVICGDCGLFTDETGRKGARLRAYDKATGKEVGAVFMEKAQTGAPMTYMQGGRQFIVFAMGSVRGADLVAYALPDRNPPPAAQPRRPAATSEPL